MPEPLHTHWLRVSRETARSMALRARLEAHFGRWLEHSWNAVLAPLEMGWSCEALSSAGPATLTALSGETSSLAAYQVVLGQGLEGPWSVLYLDGALVGALLDACLDGRGTSVGRPLMDVEVARLDALMLDVLSRGGAEFFWVRSGNAMAPLARLLRRDEKLIELRAQLVLSPTSSTEDRLHRGLVRWTGSLGAATSWAALSARQRLPGWVLAGISLDVVLGWSHLGSEVASGLSVGDVLVMEQVLDGLEDGAGTPPLLRPVWLCSRGAERMCVSAELTGVEGRRAVRLGAGDDRVEEEEAMSDESGGRRSIEDALRKSVVTLRVELGQVKMSAEKLAQLEAGGVLDLGIPLAEPVRLCIGDTCVGRGELVNLEGQVGVRILNLED